MRRAAAEEIDEYHPHDEQHQKRRQNAPQHTQYGPFIFSLEISADQLFKQKRVFFYPVKRLFHKQ